MSISYSRCANACLNAACAAILSAPLLVGAQENSAAPRGYWPAADTSNWTCRLCPEQSQRSGSVTAGLGYVSDAEPKFGDYTGLDDDGVYFIGSAETRYRNDNGQYLQARIDDLGIDSRSVFIKGGEQGRHDLVLSYNRIPHFIAQDARTVFNGVGSDTLTLPENWQHAGSTRNMTQLEASLQDLPLGTARDSYRLGATLHRDASPDSILWGSGTWEYGVEYRRTEQDGLKLQGANFLTATSVLPIPVDRTTEQVDARIAYLQDSWQLQASYYGSVFNNNIESVTWENPFTPLANGGDRGRLEQEPGNRFNQLMLSGSWRPSSTLQTSGRVAVGRMEQNELFLAPTINPVIEDITLPRSRLEGQVDTFNSHLRMVLRPSSPMTLTGEFYYDDRDNRTPHEEYLQVRSDLIAAPGRFNRPYSFERLGGKLRADVKTGKTTTLSTGATREETERTFQEAEKTGTTLYWGELRAAPVEPVDVRLRIGREQRRLLDGYQTLEDLMPEENPLLRKYHLGERDRELTRANVSYMPTDRISLNYSVDYAKDEYQNTLIGLTDARDIFQSVDLSATPRERITVFSFYSHQRINSHQSGSESFAAADWTGRQRDTIHTFGLGFEMRDVRKRLDVGLDYGYSFGRGEIEVRTRAPDADFPDLESKVNTLKLYGLYRLNEQVNLRFDYWYERYRAEDFFINNVAPDTIATVLGVGQQSPDYSVHVVGLSAVYRF